MMRKLMRHSRTTSCRRCVSILLMVAVLVPLMVMGSVPGAQVGQTGKLNDNPNVWGAYSFTTHTSEWWHHPFYLPPLSTVNWD